VWQVAHWLVTGCWEWFHLVGFHAVVLWQLTQSAFVEKCVRDLPEAALLLWQLAHVFPDEKRL
jgi:hypothetical protein